MRRNCRARRPETTGRLRRCTARAARGYPAVEDRIRVSLGAVTRICPAKAHPAACEVRRMAQPCASVRPSCRILAPSAASSENRRRKGVGRGAAQPSAEVPRVRARLPRGLHRRPAHGVHAVFMRPPVHRAAVGTDMRGAVPMVVTGTAPGRGRPLARTGDRHRVAARGVCLSNRPGHRTSDDTSSLVRSVGRRRVRALRAASGGVWLSLVKSARFGHLEGTDVQL